MLAINMIGIALAVAAVILGAWALLSTAVWRWFLVASIKVVYESELIPVTGVSLPSD